MTPERETLLSLLNYGPGLTVSSDKDDPGPPKTDGSCPKNRMSWAGPIELIGLSSVWLFVLALTLIAVYGAFTTII